MKEFVDGYQDIFNFQKDKIETELRTILEFYYHNSSKFDIKNVDLVDDALSYHERMEKYNSLQSQEQREHTKLVNEIINNMKKNKVNLN